MEVDKLIHSKLLRNLLLLAIFVNPFLFIWQGGDLTDAGFHLLRSQNFFTDAIDSIIPSDGVITYFIGGLWWQFFPWPGLLGFNILAGIIVVGISLALLFLFNELRSNTVLSSLAILAGQAYYIRISLTYNYDLMSMLFLLWATAMLLYGLERRKGWCLILSGVLIACATLARVPSVLALGLIIVPLVWNEQNVEQRTGTGMAPWIPIRRSAIIDMVLLLIGFVAAFTVAALIAHSAGVLEAYITGLFELFSTSQEGGSHNTGSLTDGYLKDAVSTVEWLGWGLLWVLAAGVLLRRVVSLWIGGGFLLVSAAALIGWIARDPSPGYSHDLKFLVLALFGFCALLLALGVLGASNRIRGMALAGLIVTGAGFIGSNTGLLKTHAGMMFLIPVCTLAAWQNIRVRIGRFELSWKRISVALVGLLLIASLTARFGYVYHASTKFTDRLSFIHPFQTPLMRGMYSAKERTLYVDEVVTTIRDLGSNEPMYIFGHTPLFYFLSEKRPFIKEFWLKRNKYPPARIRHELEIKASESSYLPLIIITDRNILGDEGVKLIEDFLSKHQYQQIYRWKGNSRFFCEIWSPFQTELDAAEVDPWQ